MPAIRMFYVWDVPTRWFHWINVLCVLALAAIGLVILNADALGMANEAKATLKRLHVIVGYLFALNLAWRIVWAFLGNRHARWRAILPGGPGYWRALRSYVASFLAGSPEHYLGHNPMGRIGVMVLLMLIAVQAITGLMLAGTDLFYPPFGRWIAEWVAAEGVDPSTLVPYSPALYDAEAYAEMRAFRQPLVLLHTYAFYVLVIAVILHVAAVIVTELREGGSLISAMFTGRKLIAGEPVDSLQKGYSSDQPP